MIGHLLIHVSHGINRSHQTFIALLSILGLNVNWSDSHLSNYLLTTNMPIGWNFAFQFTRLRPMQSIFRSFVVFLAFSVASIQPAYSHFILPGEVAANGLKIVGFGNAGSFVLSDPGTCSALITAAVGDPTIATVAPTGPIDAVSQLFLVTAGVKAGTTTISLNWVGEGVGDPDNSCNEIGSASVSVTVTDFKVGSSSNNDHSGINGDPVNTYNGELFFHEPGHFYLAGPMPLFFNRYYASSLRRSFVLSRMGDNWRHNFDWELHSVGNVLVIVNSTGRVLRYLKEDTIDGAWALQNSTDIPHQVTQDGSTFYLLDPRTNLIYTFDVPLGANAIKLVRIEDGNGNQQRLTYNTDFDLERVSDDAGRSLTFSYDLNSNNATRKLRVVSDGTRSVSFAYTGDNLTEFRDTRGFFTQYAYDTAHADPGLLTMKIYPGGKAPYRQTWNSVGKVATQSDAAGNVFTFDYTGGQTTLSDPSGVTQTQVHDSNGSLVSSRNQNGKVIEITNDGEGRRNSVISPSGGVAATAYHAASGKLASETDENGETVAYEYSDRVHLTGLIFHELTRVDYPDGTAEDFVYDVSGNLLSRTDRAGNVTARSYNLKGQVLSETNPTGGVTSHTYNPDGTRATTADHAGNLTSFSYDTFSRLTQITRADGTTRMYTHDEENRILTSTDERGKTTTMSYDVVGDLDSVTDPAGGVTLYAYDGDRRVSSIIDRVGTTITYTYNAAGDLAGQTLANGDRQAFTYDAAGHLTGVTDSNNKTWQNVYDVNGDFISGVDPLGSARTFNRNSAGRVTSVTDGLSNETRYTYDVMGRIVGVQDALGKVTTYTFDDNGWLASMMLPGGSPRAEYHRNALSLITKIIDPSSREWMYAYDPQGRRTSATDPLNRTTTYTYDERNRLKKVLFPDAIGNLSIQYNGTGHAEQRAYSDGTILSYGYDDLGRLQTLDGVTNAFDAESRIIASNGLTNTRDAATGDITTFSLALGKTLTYTYNGVGQVTSIQDWLGGVSSFSYDDAGRLITISRPNAVISNFTYDQSNRMVGLSEGSLSSISLVRDDIGRVIRATRNVPTPFSFESYTPPPPLLFDEANQTASFSYDSLGRVTNDGIRTYTWDLASRMLSYSQAGITVAFTYNGFGHIRTRMENGVSREYVWNYAFDFPTISVIREAGSDIRYFVHTPEGMLLYSIDVSDSSRTFYHFDEIGNTLFVTRDNGSISTSYAYDPYGGVVTSGEVIENPFTFIGRFGVLQEADTGLYLMRQRFYDSRSMRFISPETVGPHIHPLTINPYQYAAGNPVTYFDPVGMDILETALDAARGAGQAGNVTGTELGRHADKFTKAANNAMGATNLFGALPKGENYISKTGETAANRSFKHYLEFEKLDQKATKLNRAAGPLKAIGHAGTGLQVLSVGLEMNKLKNNSDSLLENHDQRLVMAVQVYMGRVETVFAIYRKKKKTLTWLESQLNIQRYEMQLEFLHADFSYDVEFMLNFWTSYANALGTFVPGFTGLDPDEGKSVGYLGY